MKGVFTVSLDFELIWGTVHHLGTAAHSNACRVEREIVIDRLLDLFVRYDLPATWCIVGHLFLDECSPQGGRKHPEIVAPVPDWFKDDPCASEATAPNFYGSALVRRIAACPVRQEIGCHSFSHILFPDCSRETACTELAECVRLAREMDIEMRSFAFPRNRVAHLDVLKEYGFTHFRGPGRNEQTVANRPAIVRRVIHLFDILAATAPRNVMPVMVEGLWNSPGSMMLLSRRGIRRLIPMSRRVRRAVKGLNAAAEGSVFHLWLHPTNMSDDPERMFQGLEQILRSASALRSQGKLEFLPMGALCGVTSTGSPHAAATADYTSANAATTV